jgi:NTP pyrophosphatase (non-canonical NTP hydrolase)
MSADLSMGRRMTLNDYQTTAKTFACYPTEGEMAFAYPALGLAGETGEVADKIKKEIRKRGTFDPETRKKIALELGDVLWYVALLSDALGFDLDALAVMNLSKLADRKTRDVIKGEGDNR